MASKTEVRAEVRPSAIVWDALNMKDTEAAVDYLDRELNLGHDLASEILSEGVDALFCAVQAEMDMASIGW